jgi:Spy/CpxP family protein refolding chaperone
MKGDIAMNRNIIIVGMFLLALLILPVTTIGQGSTTEKQTTTMGMEKGKGHMMGMSGANLTSEQREKISDLHQKFREENADTLKQLMTKRFDLKTALTSDKPDVEKAKAIQKEISDIKAKLALKKIDLFIELRKINPNAKFGMDEKEHGMRGGGMGHGSH